MARIIRSPSHRRVTGQRLRWVLGNRVIVPCKTPSPNCLFALPPPSLIDQRLDEEPHAYQGCSGRADADSDGIHGNARDAVTRAQCASAKCACGPVKARCARLVQSGFLTESLDGALHEERRPARPAFTATAALALQRLDLARREATYRRWLSVASFVVIAQERNTPDRSSVAVGFDPG